MTKKLQVFVSSTYKDLIAERQAAVEAILTAAHIPAGMELFTAGDESQLETIYRWIDESDIFMLILGGRYGSIEKKSGKSYIQLEYEHAIEKGKATFAVVMNDDALKAKVKIDGQDVLELENQDKFKAFKNTVLSKMCLFFNDHKDIQLAFHRTISRLVREREFSGWVSGASLPDTNAQAAEIVRLSRENAELRAKLDAAEKRPALELNWGGLSYDELCGAMQKVVLQTSSKASYNLLQLFYLFKDDFSIGVTDQPDETFDISNMGLTNMEKLSRQQRFLFFDVGAALVKFDLVEREKFARSYQFQRIKTSSKGNTFLTRLVVNDYDPQVSKDKILASINTNNSGSS